MSNQRISISFYPYYLSIYYHLSSKPDDRSADVRLDQVPDDILLPFLFLNIPIPDDDGSYQRMLFYFSTEINTHQPTGHNGFVLFLYPVYISIIS